jgi:hypothetical protein
VAAVPLRHVDDDPEGAELDVPHERTLQSQQLVEYRSDAHRFLRGFDFSQSTKYHGFPVRLFILLKPLFTLRISRTVRLATH